MLTKIKDFFRRHQMFVFVLASILFALVIHFLFCLTAPNKWLEAKWSAGDILTYCSTVGLGFLALWQNKRFKEENDIAQTRIERLTEQANSLTMATNELSIINRIIESESSRIARLKKYEENFYSHCDVQIIASLYSDNMSNLYQLRAALTKFDTQLNEAFYDFIRELANDPCVETETMRKITGAYYCSAKELLRKLDDIGNADIHAESDGLQKIRLDFIEERGKYYVKVDAQYRKLIFRDMSLSEIKKAYQVDNMSNE